MTATELHQLGWVFILFFLHLIVPGPSMLYICASAGRGELRRALAFVGGTSIATAIWAGIAVFGAARLADGAPLFITGLKVVVGMALIVIGGRAIAAALQPAGLAAGGRQRSGLTAFALGVLITMASVNELVFWSAILAIGASVGAEPGVAFRGTLIVGVVLIALVVEALLACLAAAGSIGKLMQRLHQPLEIALGIAFIGTGAVLLNAH